MKRERERRIEKRNRKETERVIYTVCKKVYNTLYNFTRLAAEGYTSFISVVSRRERAILSYYTITGKPFIIIYIYM